MAVRARSLTCESKIPCMPLCAQTRQTDRPGVISGVSTLLAKSGINISFMSVSVTADQDAVMALGLDQEPDQALLAQLPNTEGITEFAMFTEKL